MNARILNFVSDSLQFETIPAVKRQQGRPPGVFNHYNYPLS